MTREEFEELIKEEFEQAIPPKFRPHIKNVGFLVEWEPDVQTREEEGLQPGETLLGLYKGIPYPMRGDFYGMGTTMPDTITLYQKPIEEEAGEMARSQKGETRGQTWPGGPERTPDDLFDAAMRKVIRETIWHEVAHLFGMDEHTVRGREEKRDGIT
jgi:predicted Zn-dependent protease with MMP-like domain